MGFFQWIQQMHQYQRLISPSHSLIIPLSSNSLVARVILYTIQPFQQKHGGIPIPRTSWNPIGQVTTDRSGHISSLQSSVLWLMVLRCLFAPLLWWDLWKAREWMDGKGWWMGMGGGHLRPTNEKTHKNRVGVEDIGFGSSSYCSAFDFCWLMLLICWGVFLFNQPMSCETPRKALISCWDCGKIAVDTNILLSLICENLKTLQPVNSGKLCFFFVWATPNISWFLLCSTLWFRVLLGPTSVGSLEDHNFGQSEVLVESITAYTFTTDGELSNSHKVAKTWLLRGVGSDPLKPWYLVGWEDRTPAFSCKMVRSLMFGRHGSEYNHFVTVTQVAPSLQFVLGLVRFLQREGADEGGLGVALVANGESTCDFGILKLMLSWISLFQNYIHTAFFFWRRLVSTLSEIWSFWSFCESWSVATYYIIPKIWPSIISQQKRLFCNTSWSWFRWTLPLKPTHPVASKDLLLHGQDHQLI